MKNYISYLQQCNSLLKGISRKEKIPMCFLWVDSIWTLLRHGCLIKQYTFGETYKITRPLLGDVFTQRRLERIIRDYNEKAYIHLLKNKNEFNEFFKEWVHREWLWSKTMNQDQFASMAKSHSRLFVKPLDDQEGNGIRTIEHIEGDRISDIYLKLKDDNVMIEESIVQHPQMNFGNSAVNTVRVITCLDTKGLAHILRAALRVGIGSSVVDNFSAGGALYDVDVQTGRIDNMGVGHDGIKHIFHPGTDICMLGYQIPNWDLLVDGVNKAAASIPQCRFVGWDVAIIKDGIELIEGNHNPGLFTMESVGKPCSYKEALSYLKM